MPFAEREYLQISKEGRRKQRKEKGKERTRVTTYLEMRVLLATMVIWRSELFLHHPSCEGRRGEKQRVTAEERRQQRERESERKNEGDGWLIWS